LLLFPFHLFSKVFPLFAPMLQYVSFLSFILYYCFWVWMCLLWAEIWRYSPNTQRTERS
jgi:hypothetical protein